MTPVTFGLDRKASRRFETSGYSMLTHPSCPQAVRARSPDPATQIAGNLDKFASSARIRNQYVVWVFLLHLRLPPSPVIPNGG